MSQRVALTEARMKSLEAPAAGELLVYDAKVAHLVARIRPGGRPRWYLMTRAAGRYRRIPLGDKNTWPEVTVDTARDLARMALADLAKGVDPIAERKAKRTAQRAKTSGGRVPMLDALDHHLGALRERGRSGPHVAEIDRVARLALAAGVKDLADPSAASRAGKWLKGLDVSDLTRHRYCAHLIAIGKTAVRWWPADVLPREPFLALAGSGAPMPAPPVFQPSEAIALASDRSVSMEATGGPLWAFLLLSGCRFKEATWSRWDRIDLGRGTFSIVPPDAAEHAAGSRVKRSKARTVALQSELVELLRSIPGNHTGFLFPDPWRTNPHVRNVMAFRAHLAALEIPLAGRRIHALRHTHACLAIACGEDSLRLRLSMGHAGESMQSHYASQAMRWRGLLADWDGVFRLREPAEVARLTVAGKKVAS